MADEEREINLDLFFRQILRRGFLQPPGGQGNEGLIASLLEGGTIKSPEIEQAFRRLPRDKFVTAEVRDEAFVDAPLRLAKLSFNISAPHMHAMCLENLGIQPGDSVLDIGSGSGFLTACASLLTGPTGIVHGLDLHDYINEFAQNNLSKFPDIDFGNIKFFKRNCFLPAPEPMKYNRVHVGCCCPESKINFLYDLVLPGGVLVTPFGDELLKASKGMDGTITKDIIASVRFSDLTLPSDAEVKEAFKAIEIAKANTIMVPAAATQGCFKTLVNNKYLSDVAFEVSGYTLCAHKLLLAFRSPFLNKLFTSPDPIPPQELIFVDCSKDAFLNLLNVIYGVSQIIEVEHHDHIFPIVTKFELQELVTQITQYRETKILTPIPSDIGTVLTTVAGQWVESSNLADVVFIVGEDKVPAHKLLLNQIEYFQHMFSSGLRESRQKEIKIYDCTLPLFNHVLTYIYTGSCPVSEANCEGLLEQANFFQMPRLVALIESFWYKNINVENAAQVLSITDRFNALQLKHFTIEFIFSNVEAVTQTEGWRSLDVDLVSKVLIVAVQRSK